MSSHTYIHVHSEDGVSALVADLGVRGVWQPQTEALFDVCVTDTDTQSYAQRTVSAVLSTAEKEKKRKYTHAAQEHHASFSPFVVSFDVMVWEAQYNDSQSRRQA